MHVILIQKINGILPAMFAGILVIKLLTRQNKYNLEYFKTCLLYFKYDLALSFC